MLVTTSRPNKAPRNWSISHTRLNINFYKIAIESATGPSKIYRFELLRKFPMWFFFRPIVYLMGQCLCMIPLQTVPLIFGSTVDFKWNSSVPPKKGFFVVQPMHCLELPGELVGLAWERQREYLMSFL